MPVKKCSKNGKNGWKWGDDGVCFVGPGARAKAESVGRAIHADNACITTDIRGLTTNVQTRTETIHGVNYIVAPVTMIVEGVLSGSSGPIFYGANEIQESAQFWNNVPVTVGHPKDNGVLVSARSPSMIDQYGIGNIFNAFYDQDKKALKAEAWVQASVLEEKYPDVYEMIVDNDAQIEVSTGVMYVAEESSGVFNGITYNAIAFNMNGDHLALLPDAEGACSWRDGCGLRANQKTKKEGVVTKKVVNNTIKTGESKEHHLIYNALSHQRITESLARHVDSLDNSYYVYYLYASYDGYFIYKQFNRDTSTEKLFKQTFSVGSNNEIVISGDPVEVFEEIDYVVTNNNKRGNNMGKKEPCCPEKVESLIGASNNGFTEKDRDFLLSLNEKQLESVIAINDDAKEAEQGAESHAANSKGANQETKQDGGSKKEVDLTLNEYIERAPSEEMRDFLFNLVKKHDKQKNQIVEKIASNENSTFTKEELTAFSFNYLEKIANMIDNSVSDSSGTDMSGVVGGADMANNDQIPALEPPSVDW